MRGGEEKIGDVTMHTTSGGKGKEGGKSVLTPTEWGGKMLEQGKAMDGKGDPE